MAQNKDLRAGYPWVFAGDGLWVAGKDAGKAGITTSISGMSPKYSKNCIAMVKRDLEYVQRLEHEGTVSREAAAEFRGSAQLKIAELEEALRKQRTTR